MPGTIDRERYAEVDPAKRRITYVGCGHNPPFWYRAASGDVAEIDSTGSVLGMDETMTCRQREIEVARGDVIALYTDGFTEAFDGNEEQFGEDRSRGRWLMMSDVCKHCVNAPCLEVCPTGAIVRTEFDTVYIQEPVCNGCRDCIAACPFGVIHVSVSKHVAQKCTFCYDRLQNGLTPACAQACPTASIQFGSRRIEWS